MLRCDPTEFRGKTDTKRIGVALADSLDGPWQRCAAPLLQPGATGAWDDHCTTNPSLIQHPNGQFWFYYKSWNTAEYERGQPPVRGNRKYGLATADRLEKGNTKAIGLHLYKCQLLRLLPAQSYILYQYRAFWGIGQPREAPSYSAKAAVLSYSANLHWASRYMPKPG
jgi:hypothetical protein